MIPSLRKKLTALIVSGGLLLGCYGRASAIINETTPESGPADSIAVAPLDRIQIYSVGLQEDFPPGPPVNALGSITITISDVSVPLGLGPAHFVGLKLISSTDGTLDDNDPIIGIQTPVNVNSPTTIAPSTTELVSSLPNEEFFFITVEMKGIAQGKAFKVGAAGGDILTVRDPPGPTDNIGTGFPALDDDYIRVISTPRSIPVGTEWIVGVGILIYGIYRLRRGSRLV